jgi:hypothetical protein
VALPITSTDTSWRTLHRRDAGGSTRVRPVPEKGTWLRGGYRRTGSPQDGVRRDPMLRHGARHRWWRQLEGS